MVDELDMRRGTSYSDYATVTIHDSVTSGDDLSTTSGNIHEDNAPNCIKLSADNLDIHATLESHVDIVDEQLKLDKAECQSVASLSKDIDVTETVTDKNGDKITEGATELPSPRIVSPRKVKINRGRRHIKSDPYGNVTKRQDSDGLEPSSPVTNEVQSVEMQIDLEETKTNDSNSDQNSPAPEGNDRNIAEAVITSLDSSSSSTSVLSNPRQTSESAIEKSESFDQSGEINRDSGEESKNEDSPTTTLQKSSKKEATSSTKDPRMILKTGAKLVSQYTCGLKSETNDNDDVDDNLNEDDQQQIQLEEIVIPNSVHYIDPYPVDVWGKGAGQV